MDKIKDFFGRLRDDGKSRASSLTKLLPSSPPTPTPTAVVAVTTTAIGSSSDPSTSLQSAGIGNPMLAGWAPRSGAETANKDKLEEKKKKEKEKQKQKQKQTLPRGAGICSTEFSKCIPIVSHTITDIYFKLNVAVCFWLTITIQWLATIMSVSIQVLLLPPNLKY